MKSLLLGIFIMTNIVGSANASYLKFCKRDCKINKAHCFSREGRVFPGAESIREYLAIRAEYKKMCHENFISCKSYCNQLASN